MTCVQYSCILHPTHIKTTSRITLALDPTDKLLDLTTRPVHVSTRDNAIVNRLNKTKVEKEVDHESERQERLKEVGRWKKAEAIERASSPQPTFLASLYSNRPPNPNNLKDR